jgi:hypothetical protein
MQFLLPAHQDKALLSSWVGNWYNDTTDLIGGKDEELGFGQGWIIVPQGHFPAFPECLVQSFSGMSKLLAAT